MTEKRLINFVHEGKAVYPDVAAYAAYMGKTYRVAERTPEEAAASTDIAQSVCWHMMGVYPRLLPCALTIHDYRSLSVGRFKRVKDLVKRIVNARPGLRIFQNQEIRRALGFAEDARTIYLPMGVPELFIDSRTLTAEPVTDFVYIGSMLPERRCELMLDSFVARFGGRKTFDLYGPPNPELEARYAGRSDIRFRGMVEQARLPAILKAARVGVCYFPLHYPHLLQTPTKLMEYCALGMRVLANEHPQSRKTVEQYGLTCHWGSSEDLFAGVPDDLSWEDNAAVDAAAMAWPQVIAASGVEAAIEQALARG